MVKKTHMTDFRQQWWLQQYSLAMADAVPNEIFENTMRKIMERHANIDSHQQHIFLRGVNEISEGDSIAEVVNPAMVCGRGRQQGNAKFSSQK